MAKLVCVVNYVGNKVTKTWKVLSTGPKDSVHLITTSSAPFIIETKNAKLAKKLDLGAKTPNGYEVKKAPAPTKKNAAQKNAVTPKPSPRIPAWLKLQCGTIKKGQFESWGGVGPLGYNDDDGN